MSNFKYLDQTFSGGASIYGLPQAIQGSQAVPKDQLDSGLNLKQDNLTGGSGIDLSDDVIKVDLAVTGTDYSSLMLSGMPYQSLNGQYTRADIQGTLSDVGLNLDLDVGGTFNIYYKFNGNGVWAVLIKRDSDNIYGNNSTSENIAPWLAALTNNDPTSITQDFPSFIPNVFNVDYENVTTSSVQDELGNGSPLPSDGYIAYASGSTPAGLIFENNKLAIDFATTTDKAESTNVLPASVTVTAINEAKAYASQAQNTSFSNAIAQLAGNPSKVQSAIEVVKSLIDSVSNTVSNNQALASSEYGNIDTIQSAIGTSASSMGLTHPTLSDNVTVKDLIGELAVLVADLRADSASTIGLTNAGDLIDSIGSTVPANSTVVEALASLTNKVETVAGDLTNRLGAVEFFHNGGEFPLTADQAAGIEAFDIVKTGAGTGEETDVAAYVASLPVARDVRILVSYGIDGDVDAGIYVRDKDTGLLARSADFDEASEIERGDVIQVLLGGSIAFADFAVFGGSNPVVGSDLIKFKLEKASGVGDGTVNKSKLDSDFAAEFEGLPRQLAPMSVTVPADGCIDLTHNMMLGAEPYIRNASGDNYSDSFLVSHPSAGVTRLSSLADTDTSVLVTFTGVRI
jgi:hypothetical protein